MRNILLFIILMISLIASCFSDNVRKENITAPSYEREKSYTLRRMTVDFIKTIYNVWKYEPVDYTDFEDYKQMQEAKLYYATQNVNLAGIVDFKLLDKNNNVNYYLKQVNNDITNDRTLCYEISKDKDILCKIKQFDENDLFVYDLYFKDKKYLIDGKVKKDNENIQSFLFSINNKEESLASIFRIYGYFNNDYQIVINRKYKDMEDAIYISLGILIDQILIKNGYTYKGNVM